MKCSFSHPRRGFTLIELSIVVTIIGLLIGGIMLGQSLIHTATLRAQIKQIQDYHQAYNTFITKYGCVPGDCVNATTIFGTTDPLGNTINNGNGNGLVDTNTGVSVNLNGLAYWSTSTEMWGAFQQLSAAGLIGFTPKSPSTAALISGVPQILMNKKAGMYIAASYNFNNSGGNPIITNYQTGLNTLWLVSCATSTTSMNTWDDYCGIFFPYDLQLIDQKIDDGLPASGRMFGFAGPGSWLTDCVSGNSYLIGTNTEHCQAAFVLN